MASYGIKLAGSKEVKAAQRALEDAEFSDDPDGKKRRLRKRRAAAKERRARAKALREGREPGEDDDESDDDDDDDQEQQPPPPPPPPPPTALYLRPAPIITNGARAPPETIATAPTRPRARPRASAKLATAKKGPGGPNGKTPTARANATTQPRPTTTMQIQHLTQQQNPPDTMMQWDDGNYHANQDMDDSGEDEYYSAGTFGNQAGNAAIGAGWSVLDTEKILKVRNAATTLLGLALERSDVGPNDMQQSMISVLDWCRRQEESLPPVIPPPPQEQPRLHNVASTYSAPSASTTTSSRLPAQYAAHTHVGSSAQPTYAQDHGYTTNDQYSAPSYSTLASAAAAAPTSYQLPHSASSYGSAQPYHPTQAYNNAQTYSTQYNTHNFPTSHSYNNRIGL
ncbi:hypothetical protein QFC22_002765 [Naganishia vaughanmartiniae]|uniref:Uncharacterized protein n=1 Tax=Naganishia vaughanmartiniae TaxID=1424756 RepID=A0ACC2XB12_9TREE|nr:hypothetical protein QFC22_002765 [Naganishia vaughanmartiniae]